MQNFLNVFLQQKTLLIMNTYTQIEMFFFDRKTGIEFRILISDIQIQMIIKFDTAISINRYLKATMNMHFETLIHIY